MKEKGKQILRKIFLGSGIILLLLLLTAGIQYFLLERAGEKATILSPLSSAGKNPLLGEVFYLKGEIKVPWNSSIPESSSLILPEKLQKAGEGKLHFRRLAWGYTLWQAVLPLQGYENGKTKAGISWAFREKGGKELLFSFPPVTIEKRPLKDPVLAMASFYTPPKKSPLYLRVILGCAFLCLLGFLLFLCLKRGKTPSFHYIPPWEEAKNAISLLVGDVRSGKKKREKAFTFLSDILSSYIEKRFLIRSTHLTSGEFLHELEKNSSILQESQQHFLRKFLEKAELVKFAALPAENELWEQAARDAGNFIDETRIPSGKEEQKK